MNSVPISQMTPIDEGARFVRMAAHAREELAAFYDINETMLSRREQRRLSRALTLLDRFARGCHGG